MGVGSTGYKIVFLLHILTAIVGFGGVMLNGVYGARAKAQRGSEGVAIAEANFHVAEKWATRVIIAVPIFGLGLVGMSDGVYSFSKPWVIGAIVLFVVAMGLSQGVMAPTVKKMIGLMKELAAGGPPPAGAAGPPPQAVELEALGKRAAAIGGTLNLIVVVLLYLMIFKPGQ